MELINLAGTLKVAILIHGVGIDAGRELLNSLDESQQRLVNKLLKQMGPIAPELIEKVAREFTEMAERHRSFLEGQMAARRKGHEEEEDPESSLLKAFKTLKADQIIPLIKEEHPQTLAIIIAHLQPAVASEVLGTLPDEVKSDVALRLANLDKVVAGMVQEIDEIFHDILKSKEDAITRQTDGLSHLADILNQIDGASAELIIDEIEETDPELADEIKQMMFIFDDLVLVDDKGLQKVLRSVETQELALALKAASEEVKMKIYRNMSERASEILREELDSLGSVRMRDVTMAQGNITRIVQDMERNGELVISGRGGEEYIG